MFELDAVPTPTLVGTLLVALILTVCTPGTKGTTTCDWNAPAPHSGQAMVSGVVSGVPDTPLTVMGAVPVADVPGCQDGAAFGAVVVMT